MVVLGSRGAAPVVRHPLGDPHSRSRVGRRRSAVSYLILLLGCLAFLFPLAWLVSTSLKTQDQILVFPIQWIPDPVAWENYAEIFRVAPFGRYLLNTVILTAFGVLGSIIGASIAGYAFARLRFRGRDTLFLVMLATMMVPSWATLIPSYVLFARIGWLDTFLPIIVPAFFAAPFNAFLLRQFFMSVPLELEEAARIDGAGTFRTFRTIALPLAKPALIIVGLFSFLLYWNDYLGPLVYLQSERNYPLALGIANFVGLQNQDYALAMTGAAIAIAPCVLLFFFAQRWFVQGVVITGVKG
ncbi:binding-protein-dependent transport systems inner membrane component [Beutenbergia cavernae DSM 12333]|uniref:Binding-protein-dependent transport systems inner membrane component n=1 Tax=Beutenbergia cavernae (strain ATCC BAA-8 / DSM 12333 / CCUG 43141 / JCM 11478 / NBRC 16432 / NCIMB 13614 / HKI 0122) TaxID=471853 RepID=C5BWB8_BEUC1|nr:carbohydrate ABC transporter permease [Beutenbergia cavernae]ACQ78576.1 binding-protein-dependent transport systems inner membrane component [Beutenbergia cavernae DSM 12333]